jgi:hypothetical protein
MKTCVQNCQSQKPPKPRETMTFRRKPEVTEAHLKLLFLRLAQEKWISGNGGPRF